MMVGPTEKEARRNVMRSKRLFLVLAVVSGLAAPGLTQEAYEREPINYNTAKTSDPVGALIQRVADGRTKLEWDEDHGWLPSVLEELEVPTTSQTLVFSKTSLQFWRISPERPRALYFGDDVYLGWVQGGRIVEMAAVDPELGAIFYSIEQKPTEKPVIERNRGECLSCHSSGRTERVPGFLVRSVYPTSNGRPDLRRGTKTSDHTTPFEDRFGGWYVTGSHGDLRHLGNSMVDGESDDPVDREAGANRQAVPSFVNSDAYLEPSSDIVALMLLEHQTQMHNRVTRASFSTRQALHYQKSMNESFERPADYMSESTHKRIHGLAEKLLEYLFFCDEFQLTSPVKGNTQFAGDFQKRGPRDSKGRSLRDLDLEKRLLRYPCSYLIYTDSWQAMPDILIARVVQRMNEILTGEDKSETYAHLSKETRQVILEILTETHPWFQKKSPESETTAG